MSSKNTKQYGVYRNGDRKMGKTSYFCHVNAPLLVFLSMPGSFAGRENEISLEKVDEKT